MTFISRQEPWGESWQAGPKGCTLLPSVRAPVPLPGAVSIPGPASGDGRDKLCHVLGPEGPGRGGEDHTGETVSEQMGQ